MVCECIAKYGYKPLRQDKKTDREATRDREKECE